MATCRVEGGAAPRYQRAPDVMWRRSMRSVLVVGNAQPEPVALEGGAVEVWEELAEPASAQEVARRLSTSFQADIDQLRAEVTATIDDLVGRGVVVRVVSPAHGPETIPTT